MNFHYKFFENDNYLRVYWGAFFKIMIMLYRLGDSKRYHTHIQNKIKSCKWALTRNIYLFQVFPIAKILICCSWSSKNCLNSWVCLRWSWNQLRQPSISYETIKYCYLSVIFIQQSLEWIAIAITGKVFVFMPSLPRFIMLTIRQS